MTSVRLVREANLSPQIPCGRCGATGCQWDLLADSPLCPDCQESLVRGRAKPLALLAETEPCAVCGLARTARFLTIPLHDPTPVEVLLCGPHLNALLGRGLSVAAFRRLRRQLNLLGFAVEQLFLLHEAFYNENGQALQPILE